MKKFLGSIAVLIAAMPVSAQSQTGSQPACGAPEYRQFDFWIGDWDVVQTGKDVQVATSRIERLYSGCVIRENWMPVQGTAGGSLNMFDGRDRIWRQTWVDSGGSWVEFTGGMQGDAMVLTGAWRAGSGGGKDNLTRMTFTRNADGSVRQLGEASIDQGKSWGPSFDFTYRPAKAR